MSLLCPEGRFDLAHLHPVRSIPKSYRSFTGRFRSAKNGRMIGFESLLERDFFYLIEFSPAVLRYCEQPIRINWTDAAGKVHPYVADVLVQFTDDSRGRSFLGRSSEKPWLVHIKFMEELREHREEWKLKFRAAAQEAAGAGLFFRVITEREIRTPLLQNAKFLLRYTNRPIDRAAAEQILGELAQLHTPTPASITAALATKPGVEAMPLLTALWQLVADGVIRADLSQPLTMASLLRFGGATE